MDSPCDSIELHKNGSVSLSCSVIVLRCFLLFFAASVGLNDLVGKRRIKMIPLHFSCPCCYNPYDDGVLRLRDSSSPVEKESFVISTMSYLERWSPCCRIVIQFLQFPFEGLNVDR